MRVEHVGQLVGGRLLARPRRHACTGIYVVTSAVRAQIPEVLRGQIALAAQIGEEQLLVPLAELLIQRALLHALGQHLGGVAPDVRSDLLPTHRPPGERARPSFEVDVRVVVVVDENLQRYAELARVVEHRLVVVGQPPGAVVDVEAVVEGAGLGLPAELGQPEALARGLGAAAGEGSRLQHHHVVARVGELVGRGQARHPRAQDDDALAAAAGEARRRRHGRFDAEPQSAHARHQQRRAPDAAQLLQEQAPRQGAGRRRRIGHAVTFYGWEEEVGGADEARVFGPAPGRGRRTRQAPKENGRDTDTDMARLGRGAPTGTIVFFAIHVATTATHSNNAQEFKDFCRP